MGTRRKKIEIKKIEKSEARMVTFSKRRKSLFRKAAEACRHGNAQAAIITFCPAGNPFSFGHSSADAVVNRFLRDNNMNNNSNSINGDQQLDSKIQTQRQNVKDGGGLGQLWWESVDPMEFNNLDEIQVLTKKLEDEKKKMLMKLSSFSSSAAASLLSSASPLSVQDAVPLMESTAPSTSASEVTIQVDVLLMESTVPSTLASEVTAQDDVPLMESTAPSTSASEVTVQDDVPLMAATASSSSASVSELFLPDDVLALEDPNIYNEFESILNSILNYN